MRAGRSRARGRAARIACVAALGAAYVVIAACEPSSVPPAASGATPSTAVTVPSMPADAAPAPATSEPSDAGDTSTGDNAGSSDDDAVPPPAMHGSTGDGGISPDLIACARNTDCVAVPRGGCCHNGWLDAVNAQKTEAYRQATRCVVRNVMCTHLMINDMRVPRCSPASHQCEMVPPEKTSCGGIAGPANACPQGYTCITTSKKPDASGTCRKNGAP